MATDTTTETVCGTDPDTNASACGQPYILLAGAGVSAAPVGGSVGNQHSGSRTMNLNQCQTKRPVNCFSGDFWHTFADLAVPGRGPDLDLNRTYNSDFAATTGPFGYGWSWSYGMSATVAANGDVTIHEEGGTSLVFTPTGSGGFNALPRVLGSLTYSSADGNYTFTRRKRDRFVFNAGGKLIAHKDLNGYAISLGYDGANPVRPATATDASGRNLTFTYTGDRIAKVADSGGRSVSYIYSGSGDLVEVIDAGGGHWSFTYDAAHRMLTMREPKYFGNSATTPAPVTTNHYDSEGRVDWQSDPLGRTTYFDYTIIPGSTKITDPRGNVSVQEYNYGQLTSLTKGYGTPAAATWSYAYDPETLNVTEVVDPNGHVSSATYDGDGNQLTATDGLGRKSSATYSGLGGPLTLTDPAGVTTTLAYDNEGRGNLVSVSTPLIGSSPALNRVVTNNYGDPLRPGDITSVTDPKGKVWAATYDIYGNTASSTDPVGDKSTFGYDTIGRLTSTVAPRGNVAGATTADFTTTYVHNGYGDLISVTNPLQVKTSFGYDANRNRTSVTDGDGHTTTSAYDAADQLVSVARADGTTLGWSYDASGNQIDSTDGAGVATTYTYDALDRMAKTTDPLGRTTTFGYDPADNLKTKQDHGGNCASNPKSGCTTYAHDDANQVTGIDYADPATPDVTAIAYDANGRRTSMADGTGTSTWAWTPSGA